MTVLVCPFSHIRTLTGPNVACRPGCQSVFRVSFSPSMFAMGWQLCTPLGVRYHWVPSLPTASPLHRPQTSFRHQKIATTWLSCICSVPVLNVPSPHPPYCGVASRYCTAHSAMKYSHWMVDGFLPTPNGFVRVFFFSASRVISGRFVLISLRVVYKSGFGGWERVRVKDAWD